MILIIVIIIIVIIMTIMTIMIITPSTSTSPPLSHRHHHCHYHYHHYHYYHHSVSMSISTIVSTSSLFSHFTTRISLPHFTAYRFHQRIPCCGHLCFSRCECKAKLLPFGPDRFRPMIQKNSGMNRLERAGPGKPMSRLGSLKQT